MTDDELEAASTDPCYSDDWPAWRSMCGTLLGRARRAEAEEARLLKLYTDACREKYRAEEES